MVSPPANNESIGTPIIYTFNLMTTMGSSARLVFGDGPIGTSFAAKAPDDWKKKWIIIRNGRARDNLTVSVAKRSVTS